MEQEKLNIDKDELFESIKSELAKHTKTKSILYCLFCLILGSKLLYEAFHHAAIIYQLIITVFFFLLVLIGVAWINWYHKIDKTDNPQEFLTIYNKKKLIEIISTVLYLLALVGIMISIWSEHSFDLPLLITMLALVIIIPTKKQKDKIEQLRELVQKS